MNKEDVEELRRMFFDKYNTGNFDEWIATYCNDTHLYEPVHNLGPLYHA